MWQPDTGKMRVLLANEPRAYREAMATAFRLLRPHAEFVVVEPDELDDEIVHLRPHLVLSSRPAPSLEDQPLPHVLLYPDGEAKALVSIGGRQTTVADVQLEDLLLVVDRVRSVVRID